MTEKKNPTERFFVGAGVLIVLFIILFPFYWIVRTSFTDPATMFIPVTATADEREQKIADALKKREQQKVDLAKRIEDEKQKLNDAQSKGDQVLVGDLTDQLAADESDLDDLYHPHIMSYKQVFKQKPFHLYLRNSFIVASLTTILSLLIGALCAFATARLNFKGRDLVLSAVLGVSMFPPIAVLSPLFLVLKHAHLLNTYTGLVIPYTTFGLPLTIWTLHSFFKDLPGELLESARVDGASYMTAFRRIVLPLAGPGIFTCAILVFIGAWNEFIFALVFVTTDTLRTVPVGITLYPGQFEMPWGTIFAAATLVTLPLVVMVFAFQRFIISGLTAGAVKG